MPHPKTPAFAIDDKGGDSRRDDPPRADDPEAVEAQNRRRIELNNKKYLGGGLSEDEEAERAALQAEAETRMDAVRPMPVEMLRDLQRLVEKAEGSPT